MMHVTNNKLMHVVSFFGNSVATVWSLKDSPSIASLLRTLYHKLELKMIFLGLFRAYICSCGDIKVNYLQEAMM